MAIDISHAAQHNININSQQKQDTNHNYSQGAASKADPSAKYNDHGMPHMKEPACGGFFTKCVLLFAAVFMPLLIGFGIANFIILDTNDRFPNLSKFLGNPHITFHGSLAKSMFQPGGTRTEAAYLFFSLIVFGRMQTFLNNYPAIFLKSKIMPVKGGNLRSNMHIYSIIGELSHSNSHVIMEPEGDIGAYNRGNRSLTHFVENSGFLIASIFCSAMLLPYITFLLVCCYCVGRIMHQIGYTGGYGGHGAGFMISMLSVSVIEGILLVGGLRKMGWISSF